MALLAMVACGCHGPLGLPLADPGDHGLSASTPALSVAGAVRFHCEDTRPRHVLAVEPERGSRRLLELGLHEPLPADSEAGVGQVIVRHFGCTRYTIEIAVPLPAWPLAKDTGAEALVTSAGVLGTDAFAPSRRGFLWSVADGLRLSPNDPFVYGSRMELSDDADLLLRFDAKGSGARLMLMYKLDL